MQATTEWVWISGRKYAITSCAWRTKLIPYDYIVVDLATGRILKGAEEKTILDKYLGGKEEVK